MMRFLYREFFLEILFYLVSVILLALSLQLEIWGLFVLFTFLSTGLYIFILTRKFKPLSDKIKELERKHAIFAVNADKYGMLNFFNMKDTEEKKERNKINQEIIKKGQTFSLLCETGNSYFNPDYDRHWPAIEEKLQQQCTIRLLLINPKCNAKKYRTKIGIDAVVRLDIISKCANKYSSLEVKYTNEVYCSLFFSEHDMIYDPYHLARSNNGHESHLLAFHFRSNNNRRGHYEMLKEHFDLLWNEDQFFKKLKRENLSTN